ncbi:lysophospholipid acyltransferase family protein [Luteimonas terrae]|uniref:L-ornithine N(alpha)-acyltransferase n=1 Tax=Luteimonas terrae TaxID=1530191 RepID=A0ABU1XSC8_9GAMM|nr:lysophospholipid acyltransferase family protein [Luteimonas terrae]MDR7191648.1 putative hemolysin [Luteimonas terrae]
MLRIEDRLRQRWPDWFRGRRARIVRPLLRGIGHWSRFDDIDTFLTGTAHLAGFDFVAACSEHLGLRFDVTDADVARIPARGRLLVVANHPSGALDALALLACIGRVRRDVRIVANDLLATVQPLAPLMLGVRILGGRPTEASIAAVEAALREEACVVIFPAGEVSRLGPAGVRDSRWRRGVLRFVRNTGAPVLPVRIDARNSPLFYGVSALYRPAGTVLLAREMYARRARPLRLRIGTPLALPADDDGDAVLRSLRRQLYAIGTRREACADGQAPLARPVSPAHLRAAVLSTECLCELGVGQQVRLLRGNLRNPLLREIGRLRELTFRRVGEGTGRARDLDAFDTHYDHIVLWDDTAARVVGAYRVACGAEVLAQRGLEGLYSASLFRYADAALPRLQAGMELGRSFVVPECWGGRGLDALWQGIGAYLRRHPQVRWLYGPASISAALPRDAREQLVAYFQRYHAGDGLAAARRPFAFAGAAPSFGDIDQASALARLKAGLATFGAGVPTLYRQYVELCEPGGARFLAFGVDPDFSNSVDGLVELDLHRLRPHKRRRYLGKTDA